MRMKWLAVLASVGLVLGVGGWLVSGLLQQAHIGTAYVAELTCSCLFVSKRAAQSCETDYDPVAVRPLTRTLEAQGVTVSALGHLIATRAVFESGFGCHVVN